MPTNTAAWLNASKSKLEVKAAPYTPPRENEIVVKNHAVAINPFDWILQDLGNLFAPHLKYPAVLGTDLAGEVAEVGNAVTRFQVSDRVLGFGVGTDKKRNTAAEGAFQTYSVVLEHLAAAIPSTLSYENAAVLPLALSTAACGLFQKDHLALEYPCATSKATGKTLLVWGGSTSVGSNAIQLAVAAGYEVITTCSPRNFEYVKKLGASQVFDYHSKTVVKDIIGAYKGKTIAGALAIGAGSAAFCADIVHACNGNKFVSMASPPVSFASLPQRGISLQLPLLLLRLGLLQASLLAKLQIRRIRSNFINANTLMDNEVGKIVYQDFLPQALADHRYLAVPEPQTVGKGLEYVQSALEIQRKGVSAKKVVVSL